MKSYVISGGAVREADILNTEIDNNSYYFLELNPDELPAISTKFGLQDCLVGECLERRHQTGIETYKDYYFIVLSIPKISNGYVSAQQLDIYFGRNFIILTSNEEVDISKRIQEKVTKKPDVLFKGVTNPTNKLLYMVFDMLVIKSLGVVNEMERKIESQEERVLKVGRRNMVNELITLRRQVFKVRRQLNHLTYISDMILLNELEIIDDRMVKYFSNIDIKFSQLNNDISGLHHMIASLREAYESEISNQLNEIMKVFTIISTIFLPLNLVTGIYGMNFDYIPELKFKYGYFIVLGFMVLVAGLLIRLFQKKRWL